MNRLLINLTIICNKKLGNCAINRTKSDDISNISTNIDSDKRSLDAELRIINYCKLNAFDIH